MVLGVLARHPVARQLQADVVVDLNEQGQEQLGVDALHLAYAAVDRQELAQAAGCLGAKGRPVADLTNLTHLPSTPG